MCECGAKPEFDICGQCYLNNVSIRKPCQKCTKLKNRLHKVLEQYNRGAYTNECQMFKEDIERVLK